jgi:hypothetical protein
MQNKTKISITDGSTGKTIVREFNEEELAQHEIDKSNSLKAIAEAESKAARRQEILEKLGLTNDEAQLLLG